MGGVGRCSSAQSVQFHQTIEYPLFLFWVFWGAFLDTVHTPNSNTGAGKLGVAIEKRLLEKVNMREREFFFSHQISCQL